MNKKNTVDNSQSRERAASVLAQCELAKACSDDTRAAILQSARIEHFSNRDPVNCYGQPMADLILVLEGIMEVSHMSETGKRHVNSYLPPGAVYGLIPLIDGKGATHDTWARGPLTVMRVPRDVIHQCIEADPVFRQAVMLDLCDRTRMVFTMLRSRALLPLRARAAWTITGLAEQHGFRRNNARALNLRLSQDGLADLLGVTRQSTNRELKQFERAGMIRVGVSEIELLDMAALREAGAETR